MRENDKESPRSKTLSLEGEGSGELSPLSTVCKMSLSDPFKNAKTLYKTMAFLYPDYIEESLLKDAALRVDDPDLAFMLDEKE